MTSWKSLAIAASAVAVLTVPAVADTRFEVEAARANARAGGPVSERDAELLERYGCLSGTRNAFCERLRHRDASAYRSERRRYRDRD